MKKVLIFGNSGSGKSTLAQKLCRTDRLSHLDLDTLAWQPTQPPERQPLAQSAREIMAFIDSHEAWVIEGCYTDLLKVAAPFATEIIYMNLPVSACIANAKNRPWEPHKYASKAAQDKNLSMLIAWMGDYTKRNDTFSAAAHQAFYQEFSGSKRMVVANQPECQPVSPQS